MQLTFLADVTNGSNVVLAVSGNNLTQAVGQSAWFTVAGSGNSLDVQSVVLGDDGRWHVILCANYAGATASGVRCVLGLSSTSNGITYAGPGDTEWPAISKRAALRTGDLLAATGREFASVAALRASALPSVTAIIGVVRTAGYYQAGDGGGNTFRWDSASTLADNSGTIIACAANGSAPGRFAALNFGAGETNVRQWGAHPSLATPAQNCAAIQAANDNLPTLYGSDVSETDDYLTDTGRQGRNGVIRVPAGNYTLNGQFLPYSGVAVRGEGWRNTTLTLAPGTFTDPAAETYFVSFELSKRINQNNHFGAQFTGIRLDCTGNAGSNGLSMSGAQGTWLDDVLIGGFGLTGLDFAGVRGGSVWVEGGVTGAALGPAVILRGNSCVFDSLSVEHINYARVPRAAYGGAPAPCMVLTGPNNTINSLQFEGDTSIGACTYLQLNGAPQTVIQNLSVNTSDDSNAAATKLVLFYSSQSTLRIGAIYARLGVPTYITDPTTGYSGNPGSFDSATFAEVVGGRLGRFDRLDLATEATWRSGAILTGASAVTHDFALTSAGQIYLTKIYELEIYVTNSTDTGWWKLRHRLGVVYGSNVTVMEAGAVEAVPASFLTSFPTSPLGFGFTFPDQYTMRVTVSAPASGGAACIVRLIDKT